MATKTHSGAGDAQCPLCRDYEGPPSSVEAHISRMTDPIHQGEVGRAHRDDIERQASVDGPADGPDLDEDDLLTLDEDEVLAEQDGGADDVDEATDADQEPVDVDADGGGAGVPIEAVYVGVGFVVLLLVYQFYAGGSDDSEESDETDGAGDAGLIEDDVLTEG